MSESISRNEEITKAYLDFIEQHVNEVAEGITPEFLELNKIADTLHISHSHLSDTIQHTTGEHPCHFYEHAILQKAKEFLLASDMSISEIANRLTYDPSNFSKYFKKYTGMTPGTYRKRNKKQHP